MRRAQLFVVLLCGLLTACVTTGRSPLAPGAPVLVVAADTADSEAAAREAEVSRELALVPLRIWPSAADESLASVLAGDGDGRLERARVAAETRRLPWLLVLEEGGARLETSRGGEVLWRSRGRKGETPSRLAATLDRTIRGRRTQTLSGPGDIRLAPSDRLVELRELAAASEWETYSGRLDELLTEWPADPALRAHVGLREALGSATADHARLELARTMAPDSESELLAVALVATRAENAPLALVARQALSRLYPDRIDYLPELADAHQALEQGREALSVCRAGMAHVDRDALLETKKGTAPHDSPAALPFADLAFCVGYYLAEGGSWELAAVSYEDSITMYEALGRWDELGVSLNNAGVAMVHAERPLIAASTLRKAVDVREEVGDLVPLATSKYNLGRALSDANKVGPAILSYTHASDDYRAAGEILDAVDTLVETLDLFIRAGDSEAFETQARTIIDELKVLDEGVVRDELAGNTWFEMGRGRLVFGDPEGSLAAYLKSLRTWEAMARRLEQGQTHYSMALPHLAMLELDAAYTDLLRALEISVELSDSSSILAIREQLSEMDHLFDEAGRDAPEVPGELRPWIRGPDAPR